MVREAWSPLQGYSAKLMGLTDALIADPSAVPEAEIHSALNGQAYAFVRQVAPVDYRRINGIYFTGEKLANRVASWLAPRIKAGASIADPSCGAGDLLVACLRHFKDEDTLKKTVSAWQARIYGYDIVPELVDITRRKLLLAATSRVKIPGFLPKGVEPFSGIRAEDYLGGAANLSHVDCLLINPPYGQQAAPDNCSWSSGSVQRAAVFMASAVEQAKPGADFVAILPDVLRSGSRYKKWRAWLAERCSIDKLETHGKFDPWTDVDVFLLHGRKTNAPKGLFPANWVPLSPAQTTVGDSFEIKVGPVVPHRADGKGAWRPYLHSSDAPAGGTVRVAALGKVRFAGTVYKPPFVVIRRTSSPSDKCRAMPTIIRGRRKVAVENHLIIALPAHGGYAACKKLAAALARQETTDHLNKEIRCRHLTVGSVKNLPYRG